MEIKPENRIRLKRVILRQKIHEPFESKPCFIKRKIAGIFMIEKPCDLLKEGGGDLPRPEVRQKGFLLFPGLSRIDPGIDLL